MSVMPKPEPGPGQDPREFKRIAASKLIVDERVQRECDPEKVSQIANEWDWAKVEALTVAPNNDSTFTVVEGQHRTMAAQQLAPSIALPCLVLGTTTDAEQAQVAYDIATHRRSHTAFEKWRARLIAGHPHEVAATEALARLGLRLGKSPSPMTIGAVATVRRIVHGGSHPPKYGAELLAATVGVLMAAFPTYDHESNVNRWNRELLLAVSRLLARNPEADRARVAQKLRIRPAVQWLNLGQRDAEATHEAILNSLLSDYNRGLRKGRLT